MRPVEGPGGHILVAVGIGYDRDGRRILDGVNLHVGRRERVAVVGPSGSGKSTLLAIIAGLVSPSRGSVLLDGIEQVGPPSPEAGVAMVLQSYGLVSLLTAKENIEVALRARGAEARSAHEVAERALTDLGLQGRADHLIEELSGGQQQRVAIARALAMQPRLLIADEPTAELDPPARALAMARLDEVAGTGGALVLATHDLEVAERCDRVIELAGSGALAPRVRAPAPGTRQGDDIAQ